MKIVIPTYRRCKQQKTLSAIPKQWLDATTLVVDEQDYKELRALMQERTIVPRVHMTIVPKTVKSIADKRAWILGTFRDEKILMLDDDLRFARRKPKRLDGPQDGPYDFTLLPATPSDVNWAFNQIDRALDTYVHVGMSARQGNNNLVEEWRWRENTRMMYALGYRVKDVRRLCKLGRIQHREDFELCLQLLTQGYGNKSLLEVCVDQVYNTKGGASEERKTENSNADAEKLATMFPGLVKVTERDYKVSVPRKEVTIYWRKAYEEGLQRRASGVRHGRAQGGKAR